MADDLERTTLDTVSLLEARLMRVEHLLYGAPPSSSLPPTAPTVDLLADLERRFSALLSNFRVYSDLLKIYKAHPSLFQPPPPGEPPSQLGPDALRATVLSYASAFPATASALTSVVHDTLIPEARLSASLASLAPRMEALEAAQRAREAEIAALRARGEALVRAWCEGRAGAAACSRVVADAEARVARVEGGVRRLERARREEEREEGEVDGEEEEEEEEEDDDDEDEVETEEDDDEDE